MQFNLRHDSSETEREIRGFLDGIAGLIKKAGSPVFSREAAGKIGVRLCVLDALVDGLAKHDRGEDVRELFAGYYYAKALFYAYVGRANDGRQYWDKARAKRVNGQFVELCQRYYAG